MLAPMSPRLSLYPVIAVLLCASAFAAAQTPAPVIEPNGIARPPNVDGFYQALRKSGPAGEGVQVKDFTLERQGGNLHFIQGKVFLLRPGEWAHYGALYFLAVDISISRLKTPASAIPWLCLNKSGVMAQDFTTLVLLFTDGTDARHPQGLRRFRRPHPNASDLGGQRPCPRTAKPAA